MQPLRVADCLVAVFTHTDKVALLAAAGVLIPDIKRLVRRILDVVDMVHKVSATVSPALLAYLALVLVHV